MESITPPPTCPAPRVAAGSACVNCRTRKLRCQRSKTQNVCQRCLKDGIGCILDTRPRRIRAVESMTKISMASVANPLPGVSAEGNDLLISLLESISKPVAENIVFSIGGFHQTMLDAMFSETVVETSRSSTIDTGVSSYSHFPPTPVSQSRLSSSRVETYLKRYGTLTDYFPFVTLPREESLESTIQQRPFLTLGILSIMSNEDPDLQWRLKGEFNKAFNDMVLIRNHASLDILQGVLVHLAWYPLHTDPRMAHFRLLIQNIIRLLADLQLEHPLHPRPSESQSLLESERKRALLGCYYICAAYALPRRNPNPLAYSPYMEQCCSDLLSSPISEVDTLCGQMIRLRRIVDSADFISCSSDVIALQSQLREAVSVILLSKPERLALLRLYELYVETKLTNCSVLHAKDVQMIPQALISCIRVTKSTLEHFITTGLVHFKDYAMLQWSQLDQTIMFILQLVSFALTHPPPAEAIQEFIQLGIYLNNLYFHMKEISSATLLQKGPPDRFCLMASVLKACIDKYQTMIPKLISSEQTHLTPLDHLSNGALFCPVLSGAIKSTDYWERFTDYSVMFESDTQAPMLGAPRSH